MSFFRNLRTSITRGRSSSRDTTPVRSSRPGSVISSLNSNSSKRRDSIESRSDSLLNRSGTFILDEPPETPCHSNCSTLEKKSKKSKVLEKFNTFTKRKKNPKTTSTDSAAFEHHPSDNATNTYYKWQADGGNSLDYDSQNDPFNFLYEQQSSLKTLHNNSSSSPKECATSTSPTKFDSSTYRKSKVPSDLKKQLKLLKDQDLNNKDQDLKKLKEHKPLPLKEEEIEEEEPSFKADKYRTVTLNSFRKSFREKFLQQQKEAAHNPAWFVEVEPTELERNKREARESSKENRRDLLVFENDNYRPGSRSPIRDLPNRKQSPTRSPVKRSDTFKVERLSRLEQQALKTQSEESTPSIRIEFKNSITPHMPGRMVPVGVAKPMPSQHYYEKPETSNLNASYSMKTSSGNTTSTRLNNNSPLRASWSKNQTPSNIINNTATQIPSSITNTRASRQGRYQTLVEIKNEKTPQKPPVTVSNSRLSTRIQLNSNGPSNYERKTLTTSQSPSFGKRFNSSHINNSSSSKAQPLKQTYFGDTAQTARIIQTPSHLSSSRTRYTGTPAYGGYKYHTPSTSLFSSATTLAPSSAITSSRSTPSHSINNIHSSSNNNLSYLKHYQQQQQQQLQPHLHQHQSRILVAGQRRSRSPIKIPWR